MEASSRVEPLKRLQTRNDSFFPILNEKFLWRMKKKWLKTKIKGDLHKKTSVNKDAVFLHHGHRGYTWLLFSNEC